MKNLLILLLLAIPLMLSATDNTRSKSGKLSLNGYYDIDRCSSSDTITPNKDSTIWYWEVTKGEPYEVIFIVDADTISGLDTTLVWDILGRNNSGLSWSTIASGTVTAFNDTVVELKSHSSNTYAITQASSTVAAFTILTDTTGLSGYPADSIQVPQQTVTNGTQTFTSTSCTYRQIGLRLSFGGEDDSVGSGYLVDNVEILIRKRGL